MIPAAIRLLPLAIAAFTTIAATAEPLPFRGGVGRGASLTKTGARDHPTPNSSPEGEGLTSPSLITFTPGPGTRILMATLGRSATIDRLAASGRLDVARLRGAWESFIITSVDGTLVIAGSNRRGTAYGAYELSRAIGPKTYRRPFEPMLRLHANLVWPAMHKVTRPFNADPANAALADAHAIVMGSSHAEPMLRNNVGEWKEPADRYNYLTNPSGVAACWQERVRTNARYESLWTLGMRGIHDSGIVGPTTNEGRRAFLHTIIADQRRMLPAGVPPVFTPYKEVLDLHRGGVNVPADVTLIWPDDNFGYIRQLPNAAERQRPGGSGIYYHLSYLGAPLSDLWPAATPPALVREEIGRAWDHDARSISVLNVGDLKPAEVTERLAAFERLTAHVRALEPRIAPERGDAFFELVDDPVTAAEAARAGTAAHAADQQIAALTRRYNEGIAGGAWRGMMQVEPADGRPLALTLAANRAAPVRAEAPRRTGDRAWALSVLDNRTDLAFPGTLPGGRYRLTLAIADPAIILDRLRFEPVAPKEAAHGH